MSASVSTSAARRYAGWAGLSLGGLLLTLVFFSPITAAMDTGLDSSNYGSYAYFTAKGFQFGTEIVPMAGPYGFVPYGFTYAGHLYAKRLVLELLTKLCLAALVLWFFQRRPDRPVTRWLWLATTALLVPLSTDGPYILAILLAGLLLTENHLLPGRPRLLACCGAAAYLALLTLFKGTQTMLSAATLGLLFLQAVLGRNFRRLPWILATYAGTLVVLLLVAGQNPLNLPAYLRGTLELSSGYNAAASLDEPRPLFLAGASVALLLQALTGLCLLPRLRDPAALAGGLFLAGFTFVCWKHGFVRADGHVTIFFYYACSAALAIPLYFQTEAKPASAARWPRLASMAVAWLIVGLGIRGDATQSLDRYPWLAGYLQGNIARSWAQLTSPRATKAEFDAALAEERFAARFSNLPALVGNSSVDFFGYEQGYVMLNRLNYRPRPMGGGAFSVFTPWLQQVNVRHAMDPAKRPDYFLVNLLTIDGRFLPQDDAGTLRAILANYTPVAGGSGLALFKVLPGAPRLPEPRVIESRPIAWGQPVTAPTVGPDQMLLVSFKLPLTAAGRLRAALYKPPLVFFDLTGTAIEHPLTRRVIPAMFEDPVPLNPLLEDTGDLLDLYAGKSRKSVATLTLRSAGPDSFNLAGMQVIFSVIPRPERVPAPAAALVSAALSTTPPFLLEATATPLLHETDLVAQILIPPGRMGFELRGDENVLRFTYGMAAATNTRATDGADFIAEVVRPGQAPQIIFQRNLSPHNRPEDRGPHLARLPLPPFPPGSQLFLRTGRGPDNDGAWDLSYYTGVDFTHGPYIPAQFPGFSVLPEGVEANMCGSFDAGGRQVFMLNAPGALTFALRGPERILRFTGGLLPGAYSGGGRSDGVAFIVELREPDGTTRRLLHYHLDPRRKPEDRTDRSFLIELPVYTPGSVLVVSTGTGPAGDPGWDWSYLSSLRIE